MYQRKRKVINRNRLFIRLYLLVLAAILTASLSALLVQPAFAKTYVITDGDRVVTYTSFATDPEAVLGEAGIPLEEYDSYTTEAVAGAEAITVNRAQSITIRYHGRTIMASSQGETAGELLHRLGLEVSGEDMVSHGMEENTFDGMQLWVDQVVTVQETYSVTLPHSTSRCKDASLPKGVEEVLIEGQDGELMRVAEVTYVNGHESQRSILSETVTRMPVTEIVGIGTKEATETENSPVITDGRIFLPTGEVLTYTDTATVRATAYTHTDEGCDFTTSTGSLVRWGTVAVDPRFIPYGTRMFITSSDGSYVYGIAVAEDCGGDIKGDRMDLYMPTYEQCREFGRRICTLYFLG